MIWYAKQNNTENYKKKKIINFGGAFSTFVHKENTSKSYKT